ncbi:MAG: methyltransferase domain-containing protein [Lachnospiraceae bacterium]|nr:methyltransferase domain-containing protein [Lachnospiraceae bacterium]
MEKAIVFGCGRYYQSKKAQLMGKYDIVGFLDNTVKPGEVQQFETKNMVNPENIDFFESDIPVLLMSAAFFGMWEQLINLRVNPTRLRFMIMVQPYYDEIEVILSEAAEEIHAENSAIVLKERQGEKRVATREEFNLYLRTLFAQRDRYIKWIADMPHKPVSKRFGAERGKPIDRIYIERFLEENRDKINGTVMEMADSEYTEMFGKHVEQSLILHLNGWGKSVIKGNLETGEGIQESSIDCFICTQTIQFIYDIHSAVRNIYKMLKPGGIALVTAHCLGQISLYDYYNWGEYWRFTDMSMQRLFAEAFDESEVTVQSWGTMKTAIAYQYGLCAEDLQKEDFEVQDKQYPVIVTVAARKKNE